MKLRYLLAALSLLAAFASDTWGQSKQPASPPQQPAQTGQTTKLYERGTDESPVIVKVLPTKESEKKAAADAHREDEKAENDRRLARFTELLFWATAALSIIALFQLFVFGWQSIQLKRSVTAAKEATDLGNREFIAANRPWISVADVIPASDLTWDRNGAWLSVRFNIKNVGRSPAFDVAVEARQFVVGPRTDFAAEIKKLCDEVRERQQRRTDIGAAAFPNGVLFPDEASPVSHGLLFAQSEIEAVSKVTGIPFFSPVVLICVDYRSTITGQRHTTVAAFDLLTAGPKPGSVMSVPTDSGDVALNRMGLTRAHRGNVAD